MLKTIYKRLVPLVFLYFISMTVVYCIPNSMVNKKIDESLSTLKYEGDYRIINTGDFGSRLDNFTDKIMILKSKKGESSQLEEGMSISGYPRYWHGYQVFLRPMLIVMSYTSIRQVYLVLLTILMFLNFYLIAKKINLLMSFCFLISLIEVRFNIFSLSMQFSNIFILLLGGNTFLLTRRENYFKSNECYSFFLIMGSLSNFFDLLTTPMVTLGIPLVIVCYSMLINAELEEWSLTNCLKNIIGSSFYWGTGYAITWMSKWVIATIILRENVVFDAINQVLFRTEGDQNWPLDRVQMFRNNISLAFNKMNLLFTVAFLLAVVAMILLNKKRNFKFFFGRRFFIPIISFMLIASMPYFWYFILANHSQIHYWFTYRLQVITIFSILVSFTFFYDLLRRRNPKVV